MKFFRACLCLLLCSALNIQAQEKKELFVEGWLTAGPMAVSLPAFDTIKNIKGEVFDYKKLLAFPFFDMAVRPAEKDVFPWKGTSFSWQKKNTDGENFTLLNRGEATAEITALTTYFYNDRFQKLTFVIESPQMLEVYLDGKRITEKTAVETDSVAAGKVKKTLSLEQGHHQLMLKTLSTEDGSSDWKIRASIEVDSAAQASLSFQLSPQQWMDMSHYLLGCKMSSPAISFDGKYYALTYTTVEEPDGKGKTWTEIRKSSDQSLVKKLESGYSRSFASHANLYAYVVAENKQSSLYVLDLDKNTEEKWMSGMEHFGSYSWSPKGSFLVYSKNEMADKNTSGVKKLEGMPDRWPGFRNRSNLYLFDIASKAHFPLTFGATSTYLQDISPDEKYLLLSQSSFQYEERPFSKQQMLLMNLETLEVELLWEDVFSGSASFSPDGKSLLVLGSAAMFNKLGKTVAEEVIPNDYNKEAYLFDLQTKKATPISLDFNPNIQQSAWDASGKAIYFLTEDRVYYRLYKYDLNSKKYSEIKMEADVVTSIDFSDKNTALYCGTSTSKPVEAYLLNTKSGKSTLVSSPQKEFFKDVSFGEINAWNDTTENGSIIEGAYYLPPNFDPEKKYPLIVYYYGGTSPTSYHFDLRYPRNLWAALGYVVYILNPSGATGYGQEFAARHVNDWGQVAADEIIHATKKFLDEHSFADASKVGCIGASFGGFMTQLLQTKTDIFAAAISHAGISSIASYWGEGYWGYLYSTAASANSYPWNNPDLYVGQSPLFHADKINTPLLLLHGTADVNVPMGESIQMYTALKLLGKPVEFVQIEGEDHGILDYKKRLQWEKTILAWFDKYLKGQTAWWDELYPENQY